MTDPTQLPDDDLPITPTDESTDTYDETAQTGPAIDPYTGMEVTL